MEKKKRQKFKEGSIVKIELSENKLVFGRLLPGLASQIGIYDFRVSDKDKLPDIDLIVNKPIILYLTIYRTIITKGIFEIIGYKPLIHEEIDRVPPSFTQDMVDLNDCVIFYVDGREHNAFPEDCIGLERSAVWDEQSLKDRIKDYYAGKKNFHAELQKVILSKEDPRYLSPPQALRWDFSKQIFYRTDKQ